MKFFLYAIFFISGISALIFETLWFHQAGLAFGNSIWTSSLVLSGFMGGLALGNILAAWKGDLIGPPIRTYAFLEVIIAFSGVILVYFLPHLGIALTPLFRQIMAHPWLLNTIRLLFAFALLLIPSTAMGLTLPLLTKALATTERDFGRILGRLYGWNTLGAVMGAILTETHLVRALGINGSAAVACSLNMIAAISAVFISNSFNSTALSISREKGTFSLWKGGRSLLVAVFLSGFALLALEVIWFRFLLLFVLGHSLSFAIMLAVVLSGISLGGLFASFWVRLNPKGHQSAATITFASGLLCIATYALFPEILKSFKNYPISGFIPVLRLSIPIMFPVSFCSGIFFTLVGSALREEYPTATATTGSLTFANTTGAMLGALIWGFLLLPFIGLEMSFFIISLLYGAIGLLVLKKSPAHRLIKYPIIGVFLLSLALYPFGTMVEQHLKALAGRWSGSKQWKVIGLREGLSETIIYVEEFLFGRRQNFRLITNSFSMSCTDFRARRYMKLYVYLPVAIHPNLRQALLISYGVGSTAKALTDTRSLESIDIVDISRDILEMNSIVFPDSRDNPLSDSRVRVHIEDGRYFLQTTARTFDLITGEPPPPQIAGVVNLYTLEYFQLIYDRLNEGGIITYWLPLHCLSDASAKAIIKAFCDVFPDASLWHGSRANLMLVGTRNARGPVTVNWFERQWRQPYIAKEMKALGLETAEQLGALFIGDIDYLRDITSDYLPLVDNFPKRIISTSSSGKNSYQLYMSFMNTDAARERFMKSPIIKRLWTNPLIEKTLPYFDSQRIINTLSNFSGHPLEKNLYDLHFIMTQTKLRDPVLRHMGSNSDLQKVMGTLNPSEKNLPIWQYQLGARLVADRRYKEALDPLCNAEKHPALFSMARLFRIYMLCLSQQIDEARILAIETYPNLEKESYIADYWDFLHKVFGIDPHKGLKMNQY